MITKTKIGAPWWLEFPCCTVFWIDSQTIVPENAAAHRYMISTLVRCEWPMSSKR